MPGDRIAGWPTFAAGLCFSPVGNRVFGRYRVVRLRLQRLGRTNRSFFRISAMDKRSRRDGPFIEQIGWYDPEASDDSKQVSLNEERAKYWISKGAQPSDTVRDILAKRNLIDKGPWEAERARQREVVKTNLAKAAAAPAEAKKEGAPAPKAEAKAEAKAEKPEKAPKGDEKNE